MKRGEETLKEKNVDSLSAQEKGLNDSPFLI